MIRRRYTRCEGATFWIDPVSVFGIALLENGMYEPGLTGILRAVLRPGDVFLDAGANEGYFSILAAALVGDTGAVYCIEPQTRLQVVIRENVYRNNASGVRICQVALAERDEQLVRLFLRPSTNTGASSLYRHWRVGWSSELVETITVDTFLRLHGVSRVRLLKVDCEGAEAAIVRGATEALCRRAIDFIAMDYHAVISGAESCRETHELLGRFGYVGARPGGIAVYHPMGLSASWGGDGKCGID
jgi:FkbM family methyltransferase